MAESPATQPVYQKVSRRAGGSFCYYQLWRSDDHLLLVKEAGCMHEYRRFYLKDIQAILIASSSTYVIWALLLPVIMLFMLGGWFNADHKAFPTGLLITTVVLWVLHLLRGPTCTCWIRTGINRQRLPMFRRRRAAERFVRRIRPEIEAVQGAFSLEAMEEEGTRPAAGAEPKPQPPPLPPPLPVTAETGGG